MFPGDISRSALGWNAGVTHGVRDLFEREPPYPGGFAVCDGRSNVVRKAALAPLQGGTHQELQARQWLTT